VAAGKEEHPRALDSGGHGQALDRGIEDGRLGERQLPRLERGQDHSRAVPVERGRHQETDHEEEAAETHPAEPPAEREEAAHEAAEEEPSLGDVSEDEECSAHREAALGAVALGEPARWPIGLRGVAPARAVERGDVLERDEDVAVELDVRHALDRAVGGQGPVLVLAAEELDVHLLAPVLVRVVLHFELSLAA
jgi:hypothetical protein